MKTTSKIAVALLTLAAASVCFGQDQSYPPSIESPWAEWKGLCRTPGFLKYHLTIRTSGDAFDGVLKVRAGAVYTVDLQIPVASTREVVIQVLISAQSAMPVASLETKGGREVLAPQNLPRPIQVTAGRIVAGLITGENAPEWFDPSKFNHRVVTVPMWPSSAPVLFEDYDIADLVVLNCDSALSDGSAAALLHWVESGGYLFLPNPGPREDGQFNRALFARIFPDRAQGRGLLPEGVLQKWGTWDPQTTALESLRAVRGVRSPLPGDGWMAVVRRGKGGVILLTSGTARQKPADEAALNRMWGIVLDEMAGFDMSDNPPNRERLVTRVNTVEPRLHRFFEKVSWPEIILTRAETGITVYAALAVAALLASGALFVRKRMHFAVAIAASLGGTLMLTIGFIPRRTAVGETLDMVEMRNASAAASQSKLLHIGSFTGSTVTCHFPHKDGDRINMIAYSPDDLPEFGPTWHIGEKTEIRNIKLEEGSRFLAAATRSRFDLGSVQVRQTGGSIEVENSFKFPLLGCAILKNGRFLPLGEMRFGDLPRKVETGAGWIGLAEQLENVRKLKDPAAVRVLKAYFDEYYTQGKAVFVAFFAEKSPGFGSEDLIWKSSNLSFLHIDLPELRDP